MARGSNKMMNWQSLADEAKFKGVPVEKKRAVIREYIQTMILHIIYRQKNAQSFLFMGGTALRFGYNLPRFSEDLDFNAKNLSASQFEQVLNQIKSGLNQEGFRTEVDYQKKYDLLLGKIRILNVLQHYRIAADKGEKLLIKLELNFPKWKMNSESVLLSGFGYNFPMLLMNKGALLAEKMKALFQRQLGRDIYDVLFMLKRNFPIDKYVLEQKEINAADIKKELVNYLIGLGQEKRKKLALQLQPFLFKPDDINLVIDAPQWAELFLEKYCNSLAIPNKEYQ